MSPTQIEEKEENNLGQLKKRISHYSTVEPQQRGDDLATLGAKATAKSYYKNTKNQYCIGQFKCITSAVVPATTVDPSIQQSN